ncbi:MAG: Flp1 family type IVb pilin [Clostridia bacterium]
MYLYFKLFIKPHILRGGNNPIGFFRRFLRDETGMGTLEIIIIIAVLVALALVFRNFIMDMAGMIFDKIKAKTDATINTL